MTILDAAFWAVCLVLVASGATKVSEPDSFAVALDSFGVVGGAPGRWAAVAVGVIEIGVGLNALVLGGRAMAGLAAAAYAMFTIVVILARRRGLTSCGCFGARSGAPTLAHAGLNAASALVCAGAAVVGPVALADGLGSVTRGAATLAVLGVLAVAAGIVAMDIR